MKQFYFLVLFISSCFSIAAQSSGASTLWTWVNGDKIINAAGRYGTKGMSDPANKPGNRQGSISWKDTDGNLWLFGGESYKGILMNDLWKYDPKKNEWTWMSGDTIPGQVGVYDNTLLSKPGARTEAVGWTDGKGVFWLMGGNGYGAEKILGLLNDLWQYTIKTGWIWMGGDKTVNHYGICGIRSVEDAQNKPGGREGASGWTDAAGNLWWYGGYGYGQDSGGIQNDLWKYNINNKKWAWVSGSKNGSRKGLYGTKGTAAPENVPGSRKYAASWIDKSGNLWLFGGDGYSEKYIGYLNDLWLYETSKAQWTWVGGEKTEYAPSVYGSMGIISGANQPGSRYGATNWTDNDGNFWLLGGYGSDEKITLGFLNDRWKFDFLKGSWAWMGGDKQLNIAGIYGIKGVADMSNKPGGRYSSVGWIGESDALWLFGGQGYAEQGRGYLNDLWRIDPYQPLVCPSSKTVDSDTACAATVNNIDPVNFNESQQIKYLFSGSTVGAGIGTASGSRFGQGITTVAYTVINDPSQTCSFTVRVEDHRPPTPLQATLPDIRVQCQVKITDPPLAKDNCSPTALAGTTSDSLEYNTQGTRIITWTYTDKGGNKISQQQKVIVQDNTAPVPQKESLPVISGQCSVTVTGIPAATDNCSGIIAGKTKDSLFYTKQGIYTITWTYTDNNGNSTAQQQKVEVKPGSDEIILLDSLPDIRGECAAKISTIPRASTGCARIITGVTNDSLEYSTQGEHLVRWTFNGANDKTLVRVQKIIIKDLTAPAPVVLNLPDIEGQCAVTVTTIPTAQDNCSGTVYGKTNDPLVYSQEGTATITWAYTDKNGNTVTQKQRVIVKDNTRPVADKDLLPDISGECAVTVTTIPTATDNCSGKITGKTDTLAYTRQGIHIITWIYQDKNGNTATQTQRVIVEDKTKPVPVKTVLTDISGECSVTVTDIPTALDNCSGTITGKTDKREYNTQGIHIITWMYNDNNGNIATQTQRVIVEDKTKPVPVKAVLPVISGECSVKVTDIPTATDNCSGIINGVPDTVLSFTVKGEYMITWTYDDKNGNITKQQQKVIVKPGSEPIRLIDSLPDIKGECSAAIPVIPRASGSCGSTIRGETKEALSYNTQGVHIVKWVFNDDNGNMLTREQRVIIIDSIFPVPSADSLPDIKGQCSVTVRDIPTAMDNCAAKITGTTKDPIKYTKHGTHTITWEYKDPAGNLKKQTQRVIVNNPPSSLAFLKLPDIVGECSVVITVRPTMYDFCLGSITASTTDTLQYAKPGNYTIHWKYITSHNDTLVQTQHVIVKQLALTINAFPNPAINYFNIMIKSCNRADKISLRIFDLLGRVVENKIVQAYDPLILGANYAPAPYFIQVVQGTERITQKIIKMK